MSPARADRDSGGQDVVGGDVRRGRVGRGVWGPQCCQGTEDQAGEAEDAGDELDDDAGDGVYRAVCHHEARSDVRDDHRNSEERAGQGPSSPLVEFVMILHDQISSVRIDLAV